MSRAIGSHNTPQSAQASKAQSDGAKKSQERTFRVGHRLRTSEQVSEILKGRLPGWLDALEGLAKGAESEAVRLESLKYLTNRVLGSPVEVTKVQQMQPVEAPSITVTSLIPAHNEHDVKAVNHEAH